MRYDTYNHDKFYHLSNIYSQNDFGGLRFTITMRWKTGNGFDTVEIYSRANQPCYGELRQYKSTHPETCTGKEKKPTDLHSPFPTTGSVEDISAGFNASSGVMRDKEIAFLTQLVNNSVYSKCLSLNYELSEDSKTHILLVGGDSEPTVTVQLFKHLFGSLATLAEKWHNVCQKGWDVSFDEFLFVEFFLLIYGDINSLFSVGSPDSYVSTLYPSVTKFLGGDYNKVSTDGDTFREGGNYSRFLLSESWAHPKYIRPYERYSEVKTTKKPFGSFAKENFDSKTNKKDIYKELIKIAKEYEKYLDEDTVVKRVKTRAKRTVKAIAL